MSIMETMTDIGTIVVLVMNKKEMKLVMRKMK